MTVRIVADSTCDLPPEIIQKYRISIIPLSIMVGLQEFRDGIDLTRQEFYARLPSMRPSPTTAAPGMQVFHQVYQRLVEEGATQILSIHISHRLSGMMDFARQAAKDFAAIPVMAFDSRQLSLGTGFAVLSAAQAAMQGYSLEQILAQLENQIARTRVFAALDTLEFLRRSGRMHFALATLGTLLHIKPFLKMYNGNPTAERVRTRKGAVNRLVQLLQRYGPYERVALLHSAAAERAQELMLQVKAFLPVEEVWLEEINPVLGAHIGPGVLGFACVSKETNPALQPW